MDEKRAADRRDIGGQRPGVMMVQPFRLIASGEGEVEQALIQAEPDAVVRQEQDDAGDGNLPR